MSAVQLPLWQEKGDEWAERLRHIAECDSPQAVMLLELPESHRLTKARRELQATAAGSNTAEAWALLVMAAYLRFEWVPASAVPLLEAMPWGTAPHLQA